MAIKKKDMAQFVKRHLLPLFGDEWSVHEGETIYRIDESGLLMQVVPIDRSQWLMNFVPSHAINLIALAIDPSDITLGFRLQNGRGGDLWLEWTEDLDGLAARFYEALKRQANLPIDTPLNLAEAADYVSKNCIRFRISHSGLYSLWSLGVMKGLLGRRDEAAKFLDAAEKKARKTVVFYERKGEKAAAWDYEYLRRIGEYRARLADLAAFRSFCEEETERNRKTWKI